MLFRVIESLMFDGLKSRVLANDDKSAWFPRTRGVLQGSPISPFLFNLFVDPLIERLNAGRRGRLQRTLFYADDGVLLGNKDDDMQAMLDMVVQWSEENGIELNGKKCGFLRTDPTDTATLRLRGEQLPLVNVYRYLGLPVTANGIDFKAHIKERMAVAKGLTTFLGFESGNWGVVHRARVYYQYLAPTFEYGAPLVHAWRTSTDSRKVD